MSEEETTRLTMTLRVEREGEVLAEEHYEHTLTLTGEGGPPSAEALKGLAKSWLTASRPGTPPALARVGTKPVCQSCTWMTSGSKGR